ncbi:unnamed protein product, partial [Allacma fusca]
NLHTWSVTEKKREIATTLAINKKFYTSTIESAKTIVKRTSEVEAGPQAALHRRYHPADSGVKKPPNQQGHINSESSIKHPRYSHIRDHTGGGGGGGGKDSLQLCHQVYLLRLQ